jgi:hypothetical protein
MVIMMMMMTMMMMMMMIITVTRIGLHTLPSRIITCDISENKYKILLKKELQLEAVHECSLCLDSVYRKVFLIHKSRS